MVPNVWALVVTAKASRLDLAKFCSFHLDQGAERIFLYLEDSDARTADILSSIPQIELTVTDETYWKNSNRPSSIENRQSKNAQHAYRRVKSQFPHIQWLGHIDIDEFIYTEEGVKLGRRLAMQPETCQTIRILPAEYLAPDHEDYEGPDQFKILPRRTVDRKEIADHIFPNYGPRLPGGFISHKAGKVMFRIQDSASKVQPKIHNVIIDDSINPGERTLSQTHINLAHYHATSWAHFKECYKTRRSNGSYSEELNILKTLDQTTDSGKLERFFYDHCVAHDQLIKKLKTYDLYRTFDMQFEKKMLRYFEKSDLVERV